MTDVQPGITNKVILLARAANARGEALKLTEDELAFYDALEVNASAVKVLGYQRSSISLVSWSRP